MCLCTSDCPEIVDILKNKLSFANRHSLNLVVAAFVSTDAEWTISSRILLLFEGSLVEDGESNKRSLLLLLAAFLFELRVVLSLIEQLIDLLGSYLSKINIEDSLKGYFLVNLSHIVDSICIE